MRACPLPETVLRVLTSLSLLLACPLLVWKRRLCSREAKTMCSGLKSMCCV